MAKYYAPNFSGLLPLFDGKSAAGGKLYAYRAGSSIPAPLFNDDGVELGSWVSIDSNGCAGFLLDSSLSYKLIVKDSLGAVVGEWDNVKATNAPGGMDNPMTAPGDLIVGGTGGTATALPVGASGEVLTSDGTTASWAAPAAQPGDHLVKASATDASDPGSLNDKIAVLSPVTKNTIITPQGDEKLLLGIGTSGVTDGYVLTKGLTGADWAAIPTQPGDHKTAVDGADASPDYLANKLAAGTGISLTNTGSAVEIAATAQTGDHKLLVSATDASAGYLGAKLTAGANVTLTTQTDGDGVQSLEISATGGGGGGPTRWENGCLCETFTVDSSANDSTRLAFAWTYFGLPLAKVKSMTVFMNYSSKAPVFFEGAIYRRALSGWVNGNDYARGSRVAYKNATGSAWSGSSFQTLTFDDAVAIEDGYSYTFVLNLGRSQNSSYFDLGIIQEGRPSTNVTGGYCRGISVSLGASLTLSSANGWYANEGGTRYYWLKLASE